MFAKNLKYMNEKRKILNSKHQEANLQASIFYPENLKEKTPLVLVFPTWAGKDAFIEEKAKHLTRLGYIGVAVDMYGEGKTGSSKEENSSLMKPLIEDRLFLQQRAQAVLDSCLKLPEVHQKKVAAIGFCFGGLCALDLARSGASIKGVVSFHGSLKPSPSKEIQAKLLVLHGHDDPMVPPDQVFAFQKEMTEKKVDWQIHTYSNTMHAFTNPKANDPSFGTVYKETSCERSFTSMENFLQEIFA